MMMNPRTTMNLLDEIRERGGVISAEAEVELNSLSRIAASRVFTDERAALLPSAETIRRTHEAAMNTARLAAEIVRIAAERCRTIISVEIVREALSRVCPLFPFC
jgi:hypothetical protein